ncbi:MAG: DUF2169 domain-containing protein [Thermodesulfovibrionia bacterium]|nr:DUF2169 domain-containing protein [Thermodesulfovibrionia bacterium]
MEIINSTPFEVEAMPFSNGPEGGNILTVIVKGTFKIVPNSIAEVAEEQIPIAFGDEMFDDKEGGCVKFESDIVPFKPRADIALVGKAYVPGGRPIQVLDVALRVGEMQKVIRVIGDRKWKYPTKLMPVAVTKPELFTEMDLVYERAFGGVDMKGGGYCKENLVGRGFITKKSTDAVNDILLPNIEDPEDLIKSWNDRPKPVGFGFYGRSWMPRAGYLGTYDEKWRKERSPEQPEDFKFDYYNAAHPDLQVEGYLKGDEEVKLVNLTADGHLNFKLPGINPIVSVTKTNRYDTVSIEESGKEDMENWEEAEEELKEEEISIKLDTLCMIPDEERFYMVWRGICPINDLTSLEVKTVFIDILQEE